MRRNYHLTLIHHPPNRPPSAFWSRKEEGKTASASMSLHCINWHWAVCWSFHSFSLLIFDHPIGKPWFLLKTQGHGCHDFKTSWPHLAISSASLSRRHYIWALSSQTCAPSGWVDHTGDSCLYLHPDLHHGSQGTAHEYHFSYDGSSTTKETNDLLEQLCLRDTVAPGRQDPSLPQPFILCLIIANMDYPNMAPKSLAPGYQK